MSGFLDGQATTNRHLTLTIAPVADFRGSATNGLSQIGRKIGLQIFVERHKSKCSTKLNILQQRGANRANYFSLLPSWAMANRTETRQKLRRDNLARLKKGFKTSAALAEELGEGFSASYISQLLSGHRGIGDDVADKIEERLKLAYGYLDGVDESSSVVAEFAWVYRHSTDRGRSFLRDAISGARAGFLNKVPASVHLSIVRDDEDETGA